MLLVSLAQCSYAALSVQTSENRIHRPRKNKGGIFIIDTTVETFWWLSYEMKKEEMTVKENQQDRWKEEREGQESSDFRLYFMMNTVDEVVRLYWAKCFCTKQSSKVPATQNCAWLIQTNIRLSTFACM